MLSELIVSKDENNNNNNKINLLESNLREINKKYDILLSELIVSKDENKNLSNNQELRTMELFSSLENKLIEMNENNDKDNELIEFKFAETTTIMESELFKLKSQINNDYVILGYKFIYNGDYLAIPIVESVNTFIMFEREAVLYHCFIVSQLKYFKNIKKINIMSVVDKVFVFNGTDLMELYSIEDWKNTRDVIKENNPNYFIVFRSLLSVSYLFNQSYEIKMFIKNGVKKLYNELKKINIDLLMPDELRDFVF